MAAAIYKPEDSRFKSQLGHLNFSIYLILPAASWPWGLIRKLNITITDTCT
jgi:hypothetical protein